MGLNKHLLTFDEHPVSKGNKSEILVTERTVQTILTYLTGTTE
jgi:hypothetical protein